MPARRVSFALGDMREQVRRDAGLAENAYTPEAVVEDDAAALAALMRKIMDKKTGAPATPRPPQQWERR